MKRLLLVLGAALLTFAVAGIASARGPQTSSRSAPRRLSRSASESQHPSQDRNRPPRARYGEGAAGLFVSPACDGAPARRTSLGLFQTPEQGNESTKVVAKWITDENFNTAIPNAPKIDHFSPRDVSYAHFTDD